ncbi:hypothetical protein [Vulcanococcus limneticus]|uniref:hypothetical protein n=1 Tax=Vulcanococcus limneticus TaxID=2170428 RepID=UPI003501A7A9
MREKDRQAQLNIGDPAVFHRQEKQKAIDGRFLDHERFVSQVMTIDPAPYLKLVAVLHREA